jgi:hypothetical protein
MNVVDQAFKVVAVVKAAATNQAFNNIATMTEQAARCVGLVTVIGPNMPALNVSAADSAGLVLFNQQRLNQFRGKASPAFPLVGQLGLPSPLVSAKFLVAIWQSLVFPHTPLSERVWSAVSFLPARLNLWAGRVSALLGVMLILILHAPLSALIKVRSPFFLSALRFLHYTTLSSDEDRVVSLPRPNLHARA